MPTSKSTGAKPDYVVPRITTLPIVRLGADWRPFAQHLPPGWQSWGSLTLPDGQVGALVSHVATNAFAMLAYGTLRPVDQREVRAAIALATIEGV